ncbi:MAG: protein-methionine-sulfoxide reductase catalytic subunit MsrP [Chloroflexota bacterium]
MNSFPSIPSSETTPEHIYLSRRNFLKLGAVIAAGSFLAACGISAGGEEDLDQQPNRTNALQDELGDPANTYEEISNYNNYYEFTTDKSAVALLAKGFPTSPWQVEVTGLVNKPRIYDVGDLRKFPQEERIYRLRCVEGWSMVIPWLGFPLARLLAEVEPMTSAAYVAFTTVLDSENMPGARSPFYPWPYTEGLRLDEAYHDLTLMVTGLYGKELPPQNGSPFRLAVPWKYGFKSAKGIVKIELTEKMPATFWNIIAPQEYGFYANVNPEVSHPRWSQATERRIGENRRRDTLLFNGYAEQVGQLYANLDLRKNY